MGTRKADGFMAVCLFLRVETKLEPLIDQRKKSYDPATALRKDAMRRWMPIFLLTIVSCTAAVEAADETRGPATASRREADFSQVVEIRPVFAGPWAVP